MQLGDPCSLEQKFHLIIRDDTSLRTSGKYDIEIVRNWPHSLYIARNRLFLLIISLRILEIIDYFLSKAKRSFCETRAIQANHRGSFSFSLHATKLAVRDTPRKAADQRRRKSLKRSKRNCPVPNQKSAALTIP